MNLCLGSLCSLSRSRHYFHSLGQAYALNIYNTKITLNKFCSTSSKSTFHFNIGFQRLQNLVTFLKEHFRLLKMTTGKKR